MYFKGLFVYEVSCREGILCEEDGCECELDNGVEMPGHGCGSENATSLQSRDSYSDSDSETESDFEILNDAASQATISDDGWDILY